jgi:hypothetical protein
MKPPRPAALLLLAALSGPAWAGVGLDNGKKEDATASIDVTYTNDTGAVLSSVKVECVPPGVTDRRKHINLYFSDHLKGGIQPGFTATRTISFSLAEGQKPEDITCEAHELILRSP